MTLQLSRSARDALLASLPVGRLWCTPISSGLTPRARWNVCVSLMQAGYFEQDYAPVASASTNIKFQITEAGRAAAPGLQNQAELVAAADQVRAEARQRRAAAGLADAEQQDPANAA